jgi:phosphoribosylanthranilate isomerase
LIQEPPASDVATAPAARGAPLWIKICGLTTPEAIDAAVQAGANAVGFVFHHASPRNLEPAAAAELSRAVPAGVERVAVFLHPLQSLVDEVLAIVAPDWVQADAEDFVGLSLPIGQRVLPVLRSGTLRTATLEASGSKASSSADWSVAAGIARRTELVLAGGLDARNVADAVRTVRPFGVDVSSGVERDRGVKDPMRIREFVRAASEAARALSPEESPR